MAYLKENTDFCRCNQKLIKMYSNSDFERFFLRYKSEALMNKESIQAFCLRNKVPYNLFEQWYGALYHLEAEYENGKLSAEQIKNCHENLKTKEIIITIRSKLDTMLSDIHPSRGDLMDKALSYLNTFWTQLFVYLKDGCYTIDNSIAERFIRPLSGECKNSLFFGSGKMVRVSLITPSYPLVRCRVFLHCNI